MSDTSSQNKKSSSGLVIFMIILLALLSGSWWYRQQEKSKYDESIYSTAQQSDSMNISSSDLDIASLSEPRILGDINAPVKIVEHSSFSCPHCAQFHATNFKKLKSEYIDTRKAYLVFDDFPLRRHDVIIGAIARCVPEDSYFKFIQLVFTTQNDWSKNKNYISQIKNNAVLAGADSVTIDKCASSKELQEAIANRGKKAHDEFGINSTPTLVINDKDKIGGLVEYAKIKEIIDNKIKAVKSDAMKNKITKTNESENTAETTKIEPSVGEDNDQPSGDNSGNNSGNNEDNKNTDYEKNKFDLKKAATPRILGNINAPVKIVEHSSFSCPHCAQFHATNFKKLKSEYIDTRKAYLVFDDFPLNKHDIIIGSLARCVPEDSYFKFIQFVFEKQEEWKKSADYIGYLKQNAMLTGATDEELQKCIDNEELHRIIAERGKNAYQYKGVKGTPTIIVNDSGPMNALSSFHEIKTMIDDILRNSEE